jgi:hypothetical protein
MLRAVMGGMNKYSKTGNYRFLFVDGRSESVSYLGKGNGGMHRFLFATGEIWTGHTAPVVVE